MPWIKDKAVTGAQVTGQALTTGAQVIIPGGQILYEILSEVMEAVFKGQARADGDASTTTTDTSTTTDNSNLPPAVRNTARKKREAHNDTLIIDSYENILDKYSPYLIISMLVNHKLGCPRSKQVKKTWS